MSDDLISRSALLEKIQPVDFLFGHDEDAPYSGMAVAACDVEDAPAVDAVPVVHGRWECEHETWGNVQCSNCKKEALLEKAKGDVGTILLYVYSNYCPNCGATMDGGEDDGQM